MEAAIAIAVRPAKAMGLFCDKLQRAGGAAAAGIFAPVGGAGLVRALEGTCFVGACVNRTLATPLESSPSRVILAAHMSETTSASGIREESSGTVGFCWRHVLAGCSVLEFP